MNLTQLCGFELTPSCNRGNEHTACPNMHPDRWKNSAGRRPITDEQVLGIACTMVTGGFDGCFTFHAYNEPLMAQDRMLDIIRRIRKTTPTAKFLLWTNGDLFPHSLAVLDGMFTTTIVSNYAGRDLSRLSEICGDVRTVGPGLDWRLNPPSVAPTLETPCYRPFLEIVFDYYGNVRTCCYDWRNEIQIGNIHDTPFDELWQLWVRQRDCLARTPMGTDAPQRCQTCGTRYTNMASYAADAYARIMKHLQGA